MPKSKAYRETHVRNNGKWEPKDEQQGGNANQTEKIEGIEDFANKLKEKYGVKVDTDSIQRYCANINIQKLYDETDSALTGLTNLGFGDYIKETTFCGDYRNDSSEAWASCGIYDPRSNSVTINGKFFNGDMADYEERLAGQKQTKWSPYDKISGAIAHEFGHVITQRMMRNDILDMMLNGNGRIKNIRTGNNKIISDFLKGAIGEKINADKLGELSRYALSDLRRRPKDPSETYAEAIADSVINGNSAHEYSRKIVTAMQEKSKNDTRDWRYSDELHKQILSALAAGKINWE